VEEGTGSRSSWRVVATDLSCLRVMMMMMTRLGEGANVEVSWRRQRDATGVTGVSQVRWGMGRGYPLSSQLGDLGSVVSSRSVVRGGTRSKYNPSLSLNPEREDV